MRQRALAISIFAAVVIAAVGGFFVIKNWSVARPDFSALRDRAAVDVGKQLAELKKGVESVMDVVGGKVMAPPPMRRTEEPADQGRLTRRGVILETNDQRVTFGLAVLKEDDALNQAAEFKLRDMFDKQYFEHVSPEGFGPSHWVEMAGYEYRVIGENLALGNFADDADLVNAWMESPGHRENILREEFQEIGVAVGKGTFEGEETWLAVQVFGRPLPNCPKPDEALLARVNELKADLNARLPRIEELRRIIEEKHDRGENANKEIEEYNRLVEEYNAIVAELKQATAAYNESVRAYNACIDG